MPRKIATVGATTIVAFKKAPKENELPAQAAGIVAIVKRAGSVTVADLRKRMEAKITTKQSMAAIWSFYRARLIKEGYITVTAKARKAGAR